MGPERSDGAPGGGRWSWCASGAFIGAVVGWILWMAIGHLSNAGSSRDPGIHALGSALLLISSPVGILGGGILGGAVGFIVGPTRDDPDSESSDSKNESGPATKFDSGLD
jgi:hypothetical protein